VHDAVLIEAPEAKLDGAIGATRAAMAEASSEILGGFELATDVETIRWPQRYSDDRGAVMWRRIMGLLEQIEAQPLPEVRL
jgi:hypothetical protein